MPARDSAQGAFIRENFQAIWPVHLDGFTRLLVQLRKRFDGDLDLVLVLAIIGSRTEPERWTSSLIAFEKMTQKDGREAVQFPINIQSVADFSGIPRETVRRKVKVLQDKGWVARAGDGRLIVTHRAAEDLQASTGDTVAYLASLLFAFQTARAIEMDRDSQG